MPSNRGRAPQSNAVRDDRAARVEALHAQIGEAVTSLVGDPEWQAMLTTAAKFPRYSLRNQLLIFTQAEDRGFAPTRVAGFTAWKALGRSVRKGERGLAILAPCRYRPETDESSAGDAEASTGPAGETPARVLRGFRVAHVFDVSQTDGDPLPDVRPVLLAGDAPAGLWDGLAAQVAAAGYSVARGDCRGRNGVTDPATRTVTVRADVGDAQAAKTLAHELGHLVCGHLAEGYDYRGCRGRAEAEAESVAYIVTAWAGLAAAAYTVPYVAGWAHGDPAVVADAARTVTAAARAVIDALDPEPASLAAV